MFSLVLDRAPAWRHPTGPRRKRRGRLYRPWLEPCEQRILLAEGLLANGPGVPSLLESVGANRAITTGPDVQQMPSVAVDPADPQHVVIAYMDRALVPTGYAGIGVAVSHDGGSNWQHTAVPLPAGFDQGAANPIGGSTTRGTSSSASWPPRSKGRSRRSPILTSVFGAPPGFNPTTASSWPVATMGA